MPTYRWILVFYITCALAVPSCLRADQVEMQNGDRYIGTVLSLNSDSLVLQSQVLGKVLLPRSGVAIITLGATATGGAARSPNSTKPNSNSTNSNIADAFRQLGANTNFIPQIRDKFLSGAGPEANNKFNDMLGGLMNGQLDMNGLRAQAQASVDQIKSLKHELGPEAGEQFDMYLGILESFLKESAENSTVTTNTQTTPNH